MINSIRNYYKTNLKNRKGEFIKLKDLEIDFTFAMIDKWEVFVTMCLVQSKTAKLYYGINVNAGIVSDVIEKVGQISLYNELEAQGAEIDLDQRDDIKTKEDLNKAAREILDEHKKKIEETTEKVDLKVVKDEFILLPYDVKIADYQRVMDAIQELGQKVYGEELFIEVL